ncbi:hypothetical protein [Oceanibacterium hippocampi]|uniref:hypothetical protein n=1 Tax=Oceanibacterium hippocampi TaxID=745714 RepID=UPI000A268163|nr:hypothetical protein [Oceanibacterium hippocampi]
MNRPRITFDTNCFINLFDRESRSATSVSEIEKLVCYAFDGKAEISVTTRLETDLEQDKNEERRSAFIAMLKMFPVIPSIGRWDVSRWDEDFFAHQTSGRLNEEIRQILSPGLTPDSSRYSNKINDIEHLAGHVLDKRDIFVTDDKGILRKRDQLEGLGIIVMRPSDCVAYIDEIVFRSKPRTFPSDDIPPNYHSPALHGSVTFDYTNNNHVFAIGEGEHLFETKWTKASNNSIHVYSDSGSIQALALAKGVFSIPDIRDAEVYDFSSRVRTPQIGEIVVWRNVNGLYAATRGLAITDDTRGDTTNNLTIDYVILGEGGRDFSA